MNPLNRTRFMIAAALIAATLASPGCLWAPELAGIRRDLESQLTGASFHKEVELSLGPVALTFARVAAAFVPGAREARQYLRDVSRVQVAVYDHARFNEATSVLEIPQRLLTLLDDGWEMAVKVNDGTDHAWLLYRAEDETIKEVLIVVLNEDELVLVKARGRLERVVDRALREAGRERWSFHRTVVTG